jgi:hypothetical protein
VNPNVPNPETPLWRKLVRYVPYVARHKWFVFLEACKLGIFWRGIVHDNDKLLPSSLIPYAHRFGGPQGIKFGRDKTGHYNATRCGDDRFEMALFRHLHSNDHHWHSWVRVEASGEVAPMPMDTGAWKELVADWRGASRAQGTTGTALGWYKANRNNILLHKDTRALVEKEIGYDGPG